jgi:2-dehydropantoate 2-reductase
VSGARVLVVGVGGIGGTLASRLSEHPRELVDRVVPLTRNADVAQSINDRGFVIRGVDGTREVPGRAVSSLEGEDPFDWILLATQPPQVEDAARSALPWLAEDGALVVLQNGLCEDRVAAIAGSDRVVGAVVAWGASMPDPGVFERTSPGGFTLGRMDGADDPRLRQLAAVLEAVGPVNVSGNLAGARWSKLAINCAISSLGTLGGDRLGPLMRHRFVRRLALEIMTEVVAVARAEEIRLEKVSGTLDLDWMALTDQERQSRASTGLVAKHSLLLAVGTRYRRLRSSMLSAIERGRPPAVDFLNGEIVARGNTHGIDTAVNAACRDRVHAIARGELRSSVDTVRQLADDFGVL